MPSINRIRVNNVKYNFGTQAYDDFSMRMYGKNTLYDLANGGGKSVLMLLLLQNMLPNCTLDDKQPIEKLFRTGNGNTTIHSLVEWKLDENDSTEGYRYMTTGFCARKAKDAEGEENVSKDVASIEYFNYCIFYREFNKNDIINLPLEKDGEKISFQGLRNYLKDLEHRDMSLMVRIFDRKGEYMRFISDFGLHESQWEIIRGINKTEGHVRTYFETNYKTTRKVVEDLLIEEIIEKAFMVKTKRDDSGNESMAKMLMDIKDQISILAKKKKDIASYDHQAELIGLLVDKVKSFEEIYDTQSKLTKSIADICVTGEEFARNDQARMDELEKAKNEKYAEKTKQRERIECLKVAKDKIKLEELKNELKEIEKQTAEYVNKSRSLEKELDLKEAANEYLCYVEDMKKYKQLESVIKSIMSDSSFDEELLYTYVYNIKIRMDVMLKDIDDQIDQINETIHKANAEKEYKTKLISEARTNIAVAESTKKQANEQIVELSEKLSEVRMSMNNITFTNTESQIKKGEEELDALKTKLAMSEKKISEYKELIEKEALNRLALLDKAGANKKVIDDIVKKEDEINAASDKLNNIKSVYACNEDSALFAVISDRITNEVLECTQIKKSIDKSQKKVKRLKDGRIIGATKACEKVIEYIETRHGITAMTGMDYLCALPVEKQAEILEANPSFPYGVVVKEYDKIKDDPNVFGINTGDEIVCIFDMDEICEKGFIVGDNVIMVHALPEYFTNPETIEKLIKDEEENCKELKLKLQLKEEMLAAYKQDRDFVVRVVESDIANEAKRLDEARNLDAKLSKEIEESEAKLKEYNLCIEKENDEYNSHQTMYESWLFDINKLYTIEKMNEVISGQEEIYNKASADVERLEEELFKLETTSGSEDIDLAVLDSKLKSLEKRKLEIDNEWNNNYSTYYNLDQEYDILNNPDDELKAKFSAMVLSSNKDSKAIADKQEIMETLKTSMERTIKSIERRGINLNRLKDMDSRGDLFESDDTTLGVYRVNIEELAAKIKLFEARQREKNSSIDRLAGSIDYAIINIETAYGSYTPCEASVSEIVASLSEGEDLLKRLEREAKECEEEYKKYSKQQGYMLELYKDVTRIVKTNDISLSNANVIMEDKDKLRSIFEDTLMKYDRNNKNLDKAKNELLRFKGNTAATLDKLQVYELAATIRDDVLIPVDYDEALELIDNLNSIIGFVKLEKDRIEKSLVDMETIKNNFEQQCLQRCLDVKTELDKLPKLSKIFADGEAIQMVGLNVPYFKDDFLKQRMSDYIDRIVAQADDYDNDKDRMKFIKNSLTLKKLFGVIVTDMNAIKLTLYKRERIKEQSRYLKYEEAVGSTGQSQGIYIQFLISIINYISGMYQTSTEDIKTKTIFIDNPFGAAKDVYIWEPIFALLKANNVQLIVPARGATPAITGRFDVNYILGQQMSGGKQLTVVTDYTSKVEQDEVEYHDLEYEQATFDFI